MRISAALLTLGLAILVHPSLDAQSPEVRARIDAYVKALSDGSPDQFESMAKENFTPEYLDRIRAALDIAEG